MAISLTEDFKTRTELEEHPRAILAQVHRTGRPVVVTVGGKPDLVILDAKTYERKLRAANLRSLLAPAEADVRAGRTRPLDEFLAELKAGLKAELKNGKKKVQRRSRA